MGEDLKRPGSRDTSNFVHHRRLLICYAPIDCSHTIPQASDSMSQIIINGPSRLRGEVAVRGAKNAAIPVLIAAAAATEPVFLDNMPAELHDIRAAADALRHIGCGVEIAGGDFVIQPPRSPVTHIPSRISSSFRSSLLFLGLLVGRYGRAEISMPGGCKLGDRKFDLHLEGLRKLGARVRQTGEKIVVTAKRLSGADIHFYLPTTTGTETVILAACYADGPTRIFNANTRPEVADMAACLNAMGADVSVKNRVVEVQGGRPLFGCRHTVMQGWDEALTYILAAGMTGGEVCVRNFSLEHVRSDVAYLRSAGVEIFEWGGNIYASAKGKSLRAFDLFTAPYPGVNSDMQPLFAAFASVCDGESSVTDQRFTERFQYVSELEKFGMPIKAYGNCAIVRGPARLAGAEVRALDLRCGAALVLAGLSAEGTTVVHDCHQIERGYEDLVPKLQALGADMTTGAESPQRAIIPLSQARDVSHPKRISSPDSGGHRRRASG